MCKNALIALALLGVGLGYAAGVLANSTVSAQAGGSPYAAAAISQPTGGYATDGKQLDSAGNPILDASYHRDGADPDPNNPTNTTRAQVNYGQIHHNSQDQAGAGDGRQVLYGTLHNVPTGADYRWQVNFTVQHDHLARVVNGLGVPPGCYSAQAWGVVSVAFDVLTEDGGPLTPPQSAKGDNSMQATRETGQVGDETINGDRGEFTFSQELRALAGTNKAKLVLYVTANVLLHVHRPEVDVGGSSRMAIKPGGTIRAVDKGTVPNTLLKKADGTDAEWPLE